MTGENSSKELSLFQMLQCIALLPKVLEILTQQERHLATLKREMATDAKKAEVHADGWLDAKEAARYMGISDTTFDKYRYKTTPRVKGYPLEGKVLYKKSDLDSFVKLYALKSSGLA